MMIFFLGHVVFLLFWIWRVSSCALTSLRWPQDGRVPELYEPGVRLSLGATSQCFSGRQDVRKLGFQQKFHSGILPETTGDHVLDLISLKLQAAFVSIAYS